MKLIFLFALVLLFAIGFAQSAAESHRKIVAVAYGCPNDTTERFYDKEQGVLYVYELKYLVSENKCIAARSFWVVLPSGRKILISRDIWEKKTGKVVKLNNN